MRITRNQPVVPAKLELAKQLRRSMTSAERKLWLALRNNALGGWHFRRQQVVAGFVVDFYCAKGRLAIELDGSFHARRSDHDAERDHALAQLGVRTLRIPNQWMDQDLPGVLSMIAEATSPLAPLPSGEGTRTQARRVRAQCSGL